MENRAIEFATRIKALGFRVWLAERDRYGFISDDTGARVVSFSFSDGTSLGGNYGPPSTISGTGWRMDTMPDDLQTASDVRRVLDTSPPPRAGNGWKYMTTVEQHLATYGTSSRYREI